MKKKHIIILCMFFLCLLALLIVFNSTKYICRVSSPDDSFEKISDATTSVPFISEGERDRLLDRVIHRELKSFSNPITFKIASWDLVLHEGKETLFYVLRAVDAEGFAAMFSVIIQPRW